MAGGHELAAREAVTRVREEADQREEAVVRCILAGGNGRKMRYPCRDR